MSLLRVVGDDISMFLRGEKERRRSGERVRVVKGKRKS